MTDWLVLRLCPHNEFCALRIANQASKATAHLSKIEVDGHAVPKSVDGGCVIGLGSLLFIVEQT